MLRYNLPVQITPFIGREAELAEIARLLADPDCRLLTLAGPGGIGKTRLALEAAAQAVSRMSDLFEHGVFFISLQSLNSGEYIIPALAEAVQFPFSSQSEPRSQLLNYLNDRRLLLLFDNFEHLLGSVQLLSAILESAAQVKILVTSREVLGLQEEWIRPVRGLEYPEEDRAGPPEAYSALRLFSERARRVQANFSLERERDCALRICRLVQGMPLAIELAAAWLKSMPCSSLAEEIQGNLDMLTATARNVPERHRSMRAVFEQTWKLLGDVERRAFANLSVFHGGFTADAAAALIHAPAAGQPLPVVLNALVDKSLLRIAPSGRYEIHELLRQYALEKLEQSTEARALAQERHACYYASFLEREEARLKGSDQIQALAEIDAEIDNLRAAWRWAVENGDEGFVRQSMGSLFMFYQMRTWLVEGLDAFRRAADRWEAGESPLSGELCLRVGWFSATLARYDDSQVFYRIGLNRLERDAYLGTTAMALGGLSFFNPQEGNAWTREELGTLFQENTALFEAAGDRWGAAWSLYSLGAISFHHDRQMEQARTYLLPSLDHFRATGDPWGSTWSLNQLALVYREMGLYQEAKRILEESLRICQTIGDLGGVGFSLSELAEIAAKEQEYGSSWRYLFDALQIGLDTKRDFDLSWNLVGMAGLLEVSGKKEEALSLLAFIYENPRFHFSREYLMADHLSRIEAELPAEVYARAWRRWEGSSLEEVIDALRAEYAPQEKASQRAATAPGAAPFPRQPLVEPLSGRELEVLALVAAGLSNREIARELYITLGAVKKHLNNIFGKLQVESRTQAVARGRSLGLIPK